MLLFVWFQRRAQGQMGNIMSIGRSKAKTYSSERPGTTFDDVAGYVGVKQEVREVVDFLKDRREVRRDRRPHPQGRLAGRPARYGQDAHRSAVAGEAGVPFLSVTGSDFMEMFVGVGASRVRDLFQSARKMGRAIIFVDEIDSIGRKRGAGLGGGHDEREQTLNQMLAEMDGFEATEGIVMMAATNRPDILDPALLRPGRFDRQVIVPLPELEDRRAILDVHVKSKRMAPDVDLNVVARGTPGMSGADLANLINEAALIAVRAETEPSRRNTSRQPATGYSWAKPRSPPCSTPKRRNASPTTSRATPHGGACLPHADPLHKVSIIPRGMALGVTMTLPEEDRYLLRESYVNDELVKMLGGRMAEDLVFGEVSSGAADDLARATEMAGKMVREWGMSTGSAHGLAGAAGQVFLGEDMGRQREYSDDMAASSTKRSSGSCAKPMPGAASSSPEHRNSLDLVARSLLEHETIDGAEVDRLIELGKPSAAGGPPSRS